MESDEGDGMSLLIDSAWFVVTLVLVFKWLGGFQ